MLNFPDIASSENVTLRPLRCGEAEALHTLTNDPKIADIISFLSYPVPRSVIDDWIKKNQGLQERVYGIFDQNNILMGQIGAHQLDHEQKIEIGYWVGSAFWGRGIGTQAVSALVAALRTSMPDYEIFAECLPNNMPSLRVLEKSGFCKTSQPGHRPGRILLLYQPS